MGVASAGWSSSDCSSRFSSIVRTSWSVSVKAQKALHELRKEAGALVAKSAGIYAASRLLRHSDIRVTADFYADKKQRISTGLGALLPPAENVIPFPADTSKAKASKAAKKSA